MILSPMLIAISNNVSEIPNMSQLSERAIQIELNLLTLESVHGISFADYQEMDNKAYNDLLLAANAGFCSKGRRQPECALDGRQADDTSSDDTPTRCAHFRDYRVRRSSCASKPLAPARKSSCLEVQRVRSRVDNEYR